MTFVLTYSSLVTSIQQYCERQDQRFIASIPTFIMLGQRRVCRDLKILQTKVFVNGTLTTGQSILNKPGNWLNTSSFQIGTGTDFNTTVLLESRSYAYGTYYWPYATQTAQPKYYSDEDINSFQLYPTPDQNYPYQLVYFQLPPLLDETTGTNVLTSTIPDVLLFACLAETASFLKDDDRIPMWEARYAEYSKAISDEDLRRIYDGFTIRGS